MKFRGLVMIVAASALLVLAAPASSGRRDATFNDAVGDKQGGAPDISIVTVTNVGNRIGMRIVADQAALNPDSGFIVYFDSDRNPATGEPNTLGADFLMFIEVVNGQVGAELDRWTGTALQKAPSSSLSVGYNGGATIFIDRSELANTTGFNFWVRGVQVVSSTQFNIDDAPNDGTWPYILQAPAAAVTAVGQSPTPYPPRAGKTFTMRVPYVRLSDGRRAKPTSYRCTVKAGGKKLAGKGTGGCTVKIPAGARGKTLSVAITAAFGTSTKTVTFFAKIA
jgi:hypothetical protein